MNHKLYTCMLTVVVLTVITYSNVVNAQGTPSVPAAGVTITPAIPASPDAAALGKYGNIPVSPYTGVPNISIPLYTIKSGDLSLPVSLSYHSGGNKIEEMASSVGLGWTLNAGGAITRTIRGKADESAYGFLNETAAATINSELLNATTLPTQQQQTLDMLLNETADGTIDSEPDIYSYNFGGYSGKFVMDGSGNVYVMPLQDIKFTFSVSGFAITSFVAQTPDGVKYYFGSTGATEFSIQSGSSAQSAVSWFLTRVLSPTGHEIDLTYAPEAYDITAAPSQTFYQALGNGTPPAGLGPPPVQPQSAVSTCQNVKLSSISFENGTMQVFANNYRLDLKSSNPSTGAKEIDQIVVSGASFSKTFNFYYYNQASSRLQLDSMIAVVPSVSGGSNAEQKYSFLYNGDPWSSNSMQLFSQDWWGYYNGQGNILNDQGVLVPQDNSYYDKYTGMTLPLPGANRAPDENSMMGGMLTQINYPTGGFTKFTYEANEEYNINLQGTSPKYPTAVNQVALSNDPGSIYYNYDSINNNPGNTFTIATAGPSAPVTLSAGGIEGSTGPPNDFIRGYIYSGTSQSSVFYVFNDAVDTTIYLPPGTYNIGILDNKGQAYNPTTNPNGFKYYLSLSYSGYTQATVNAMINNYIAGGLRIKQIADYDGISNKPINLRTYSYLQPGTTVSSGNIDFQPNFEYELNIESQCTTCGGDLPVYTVNDYLTRTSVSNYPFSTSEGSVVSYSHVEETYGASGQNGMNEYFYTNSASNPDLQDGIPAFPFPPATDQSWHRGLLLKETQWKQAGSGTYAKVNETAKAYTTINLNSSSSIGIKAGFNPKPANYSQGTSYFCNPPLNEFGRVKPVTYYNFTDYTYLSSDTTRVYNASDQTKYVQTWNNYQFDPATYQLTQLESINSKGDTLKQNVTYANDYTINGTTNSALLGLQNLQLQNIVSAPVEEVTQRKDAGTSSWVAVKAVLSTYKPTLPCRDSVYEMRSVTPVTGFLNSSAGTNSLIKDSHYQPVVSFDKYDAYGSIIQERKVGDAPHTYIWSYTGINMPYNNTCPAAEVINADSADVAYTNFESYPIYGNVSGNWVYSNSGNTTDATAPMGAQCYNVSSSNTLVKSGLNTGTTYVVSLWAKSGTSVTLSGGTVSNTSTGNLKSGWQYQEYQVSGASSVAISGSGYIDEVRLYPVNALMSTYTYIPLVGIAGKCDSKNNITYYNYDNVGRLSYIQDQNRNIVKSYNYNYQGQ
jgi:hypothetical protein